MSTDFVLGDDFARVLTETTQALVCVLDRDGRILLFNDACERATGYGRDEEGRRAAQAAGRAVPGTALEPGAPDRVCDDLLEAAKWTLASPEIDRPE